MSRGNIREGQKQSIALRHLGYEIDVKGLRLVPYLQYCLVNGGKVERAKINDDDRYWLNRWTEEGRIRWHAPWVDCTKPFWDFMSEILWDSCVETKVGDES